MPSITGTSHVALTVRDMDASAKWYQDVFGWQAVRRLSGEEAGSPRILLFDPQSRFMLAVCQPVRTPTTASTTAASVSTTSPLPWPTKRRCTSGSTTSIGWAWPTPPSANWARPGS